MITETQINKTMRTLYIIWLVLMCSLVGYLVLGYAFPENANPTPMAPEMFQTLKMVVYGLAFFAAIAAGFLRRLVLSGNIIKVKTNNPSVDPVLSRYATGVILALALLETGGGLRLCPVHRGPGHPGSFASYSVLRRSPAVLQAKQKRTDGAYPKAQRRVT